MAHTANLTAFSEIPLVDLGPLVAGAPGAARTVARAVGRHAAEVGFFYVRNHGVSQMRG